MGNSTVVQELKRALRAISPPAKIQVFFPMVKSLSNDACGPHCLYIDHPAWQSDGQGGGAIIGDGPMSYDPYAFAGWRVVKE